MCDKAHKNNCRLSHTVPEVGTICTESIMYIKSFHEEFPPCLEGTIL